MIRRWRAHRREKKALKAALLRAQIAVAIVEHERRVILKEALEGAFAKGHQVILQDEADWFTSWYQEALDAQPILLG